MKKFYDLLVVNYLLLSNHYDEAMSALADIQPIEEDEFHWLNYYYYFFRGHYHYNKQYYKAALENYLKARPILPRVGKLETAEFNYKLASAYQRIYQFAESIECLKKALTTFKEHAEYFRMAHCENVLGINYKDIKQYKVAEFHYHNALIYAEKTERPYLRMIVLHNFGAFYSEQNKAKKALRYLKQAYELIDSSNNQLQYRILYLLAKNSFDAEHPDEAAQYLDKGLAMTENESSSSYFHHFQLLKAKFIEPARFEQAYVEGIAYFKENERWQTVIQYGEELAAYYRGIGEHEQSSKYFFLAMIAKNKIEEDRRNL
jgi:tetratricopeptide (TPR) repeat protein